MRSENHIRSKYKLKMWIVLNSEPPLSGYAEAELRALNNRACATVFRPLLAQTCQRAPPIPFEGVVKTIANTSSFQKPFVKLPPGNEDKGKKEHTFEDTKDIEMVESASTAGEPPVVEDYDAEKLPGMRWTEKWKETALAEGAVMTAKQDVVKRDNHDRVDMTARGPTAVQHHPTPSRGKFKVNIPLPSADQLTFHPPISRQRSSEGRHVTFPSMFSQTSFQIPAQAMSPTLTVMTSLPIEKSCQTSPAHTPKPANEVGTVDIAWEYYSNQKHAVITKNIQSPTKEKFSGMPEQLPTFPFTETIGTFPFKPIFDSPEPITLPAPTTTQSRSSIVLSSPSTIPSLNIRNSRPHNPPICHEWNYYMPCIQTMYSHCPRLHVCEICSSREHRATQHWHHLATAPLPEIQSQPKLSSFAPPPESPTLSALGELRAPARISPPHNSVVGSIQEDPMFGLPHVSLFIPSFGLGGGVQSGSPDRLRPRKRPCRTMKTSPPPQMEIKNGSDKEVPAVEAEAAQIASIPTTAYPFEKPLEVILPPPVKPFQRKAAIGENSVPSEPTPSPQPAASTPGRLRVTAPAFEPSSPSPSPSSVWVPFTGSNPQFNDLFKIPSRQNRRIAIVPPPQRHKKPEEHKSESASKQRENKRREKQSEEEKDESVKGKRDRLEGSSPMKAALEKPPDKIKDEHGAISSAQLGSASTKTLTKQKCDTSGPTSSACIDKTDSGIWAGSIPTYTMANFDHLKDHFDIDARTWPPVEGRCHIKPIASGSSAENFPRLASSLGLDSVDRSVIAILDDELEAVMAKASEEEVAKTLETIIEIRATPSSSCCTTASQPSKFPQHHLLQASSPARNLTLSTSTTSLRFAAPGTRFVTLEDFADDLDSALRSIDAAEGPAPTESVRPRSSDSSSTAPLSPCGSPHSARSINTRTPLSAVPFKPVESLREQMMSCPAARGAGQCDCGLGDWFRHGTGR